MTWLNKISLFFNVTTSIKVFFVFHACWDFRFCFSCEAGIQINDFLGQNKNWDWVNKLCRFFPLFYEMLKQDGIITAEIRGLHSTVEAFLLATQQPRVWYQALQRFLSLLLSLWAVLRSNLSSAKQRISQMQLAMMSRAKYYKKLLKRLLWE